MTIFLFRVWLAASLRRMDAETENTAGWRGSRALWLDAARQVFVETGVDAVKIQPLAERLALSRTSFYWFFN